MFFKFIDIFSSSTPRSFFLKKKYMFIDSSGLPWRQGKNTTNNFSPLRIVFRLQWAPAKWKSLVSLFSIINVLIMKGKKSVSRVISVYLSSNICWEGGACPRKVRSTMNSKLFITNNSRIILLSVGNENFFFFFLDLLRPKRLLKSWQ